MKYILCMLIFVLTLPCFAGDYNNDVNPVIKNESFIEKFGFEPDASAGENLRISTHLAYVESLLRKKDISHLTSALRKRRMRCIALLHNYRKAGVFPQNKKYASRTPCFIDGDGKICAVGYLLAQTAGRAMAEKVNSLYQYAHISDMHMKELKNWIAFNGLTLEECAMIQPTYNYYSRTLPAGFKIGTVLISGLSLVNTGSNLHHIIRKDHKYHKGVWGMFSGVLQMGWGLFNYSMQRNTIYSENPAGFFYTNMAVGATSFLTGGLNFFTNRDRQKNAKNKVGFYSLPVNSTVVYGISFQRNL